MPIGLGYKQIALLNFNNDYFYLRVTGMSILSVLGDPADFGEDKKKELFPLLPLIKPEEI
jgi:hypothetical protein